LADGFGLNHYRERSQQHAWPLFGNSVRWLVATVVCAVIGVPAGLRWRVDLPLGCFVVAHGAFVLPPYFIARLESSSGATEQPHQTGCLGSRLRLVLVFLPTTIS
jgi:hypothetical protein